MEGAARFQDKKPVSRAVLSAASCSYWEGDSCFTAGKRNSSGFPKAGLSLVLQGCPLKDSIKFFGSL